MQFHGFDTETTGLLWWGKRRDWGFHPARPFAFSFCDADGETDYHRWDVDTANRRVITGPREETEHIVEFCEDDRIHKIGHNVPFDMRMIELSAKRWLKRPIRWRGAIGDTLTLGHIATGGDELNYGLKELSAKYIGIPSDDEKDLKAAVTVARKYGKRRGWAIADNDVKPVWGNQSWKADMWLPHGKTPRICEEYATTDAERTILLWLMFYETVMGDPGMRATYEREMAMVPIIRGMMDRGLRIFPRDLDRLFTFYGKIKKKQRKIAAKHGKGEMNFRSPKQMAQTFYIERGNKPNYTAKHDTCPGCKMCPHYSIKAEHLVEIAKKDDLAAAILEYRTAAHCESAFLNKYRAYMHEESDGIWALHTNLRNVGPATGRMASADPNLMNVASATTGLQKSKTALRPRECFGPRPGYIWYFPDYSQIEVWIFAFHAEIDTMCDLLLAGHDFHGSISKQVFGGMPDFKSRRPMYRKRTKLIKFCKIFGGGPKRIAFILNVPGSKAQDWVDRYDQRYPGVNRHIRRMERLCRKEGFITNSFGRRYYLPPDHSYKACNYDVQGTAADVFKEGILELDELFSHRWPGIHMLLPLHDEIIIEVPIEYHSQRLCNEITEAMQVGSKQAGIPVPLPVNIKIARERWHETTKLKLTA